MFNYALEIYWGCILSGLCWGFVLAYLNRHSLLNIRMVVACIPSCEGFHIDSNA